MLKKNDLAILNIEEINDLGYGVGRIDGMVTFVAGGVTGDSIEARLIKVNASYAVARIERVLVSSPLRSEPPCPVFRRCGGCSYLHVKETYEKEIKENHVRQAFLSQGLSPRILPIRDDGRLLRYRNKAMFPVDSTLAAGFFRAKSNEIVENHDCLLQPECFREILECVLAFAGKNGIAGYDREKKKGLLRHVYLRIGEKTGEIMACLVVNGASFPKEKEFCTELTSRFPAVKSILLSENRDPGSRILGDSFRLLWGKDSIEDVLCGVSLSIHPNSFYQVNRGGAELLYGEVIDRVRLCQPKKVLDLFCGIGSIGLAVAKAVGGISLTGYEIVPQAVENAKENAVRNGIRDASFFCGDLEQEIGSLDALLGTSDLVILDPPRKGIEPTLAEKLIASRVRHIVYVSCDCKTLARDAALLTKGGYSVGEVTPVNLFPRTGHVECVVLLSKKES